MGWQHWIVVGYFVLNGLGSVFIIGKERPPVTPSVAVVMLISYAILIWLVAAG